MLNHSARPHTSQPDPLRDARDLQVRIAGLRALLNLQLHQIESLNERLQPATPAGRAASRLLTLKEGVR
jgi:hypothetical protein